jgi:hypothetical protein
MHMRKCTHTSTHTLSAMNIYEEYMNDIYAIPLILGEKWSSVLFFDSTSQPHHYANHLTLDT